MKKVNILTFILIIFIAFPLSVQAGEMEIEEGSVFSNTFEKDGWRVEVTKTYTAEGVVVRQITYNQAGELISDKTTTSALKDNVRIVPQGSVTPFPKQRIINETGIQTDAKVESLDLSDKVETDVKEIDILNVEKSVGPESKVDDYQEKLGLNRVDKVLVKNTENSTEIAVDGVKNKKLLGILNIEIPVKFVVDLDTGEVKSQTQSFASKILESLSL